MTNKYGIKDLIKKWEQETLTEQQAIGQLILWIQKFYEDGIKTNNFLDKLKARVEEIAATQYNREKQIEQWLQLPQTQQAEIEQLKEQMVALTQQVEAMQQR